MKSIWRAIVNFFTPWEIFDVEQYEGMYYYITQNTHTGDYRGHVLFGSIMERVPLEEAVNYMKMIREINKKRIVVYVATVYRYGDKHKHSYVLGAFSELESALKVAAAEYLVRGGKYKAEIIECEIDRDYRENGDVPTVVWQDPDGIYP